MAFVVTKPVPTKTKKEKEIHLIESFLQFPLGCKSYCLFSDSSRLSFRLSCCRLSNCWSMQRQGARRNMSLHCILLTQRARRQTILLPFFVFDTKRSSYCMHRAILCLQVFHCILLTQRARSQTRLLLLPCPFGTRWRCNQLKKNVVAENNVSAATAINIVRSATISYITNDSKIVPPF
jgi:hypothetical protein